MEVTGFRVLLDDWAQFTKTNDINKTTETKQEPKKEEKKTEVKKTQTINDASTDKAPEQKKK